MDYSFLFFISSGLFLGWSLGANDAANIFGTAVGTKMVKFKTAAVIASVFVTLGAVYAGAGASQTLGDLGAINAIAGSFMTAFAAALTVYWMVKSGLTVSTSQAIVGAIVGWNLYSGKPTDISVLSKIISTWIFCPLISGGFAIALYYFIKWGIKHSSLHLLRLDQITRWGLILTGAFGAYALGANNIANVMGAFVEANPFRGINLRGFSLNGTQVLFLIGSIAISVGVFTYSQKTMATVGKRLMSMSPQVAWIVVLAQSLTLFIFSSQGLKDLLTSMHLPSLPLVPVSCSQAVIGAVIGVGLAKGGREIKWGILGRIAIGWITTPVIAGILCFVALFFLENVFQLQVYH